METIQEKINRFYDAIEFKEPGKPDSRYKSWEYCHAIFMQKHEVMRKNKDYTLSEEDANLLALHLGFYLASWGMYRGSSFLLQRDYKTHRPVVEVIMKEDYSPLWEFDPRNGDKKIKEALNLLFGKDEDNKGGLNAAIRHSYGDAASAEAEEAESQKEGTDTLITKILMGTFACVPAFDRFLRAGIANQKKFALSSNIPDDSLASYVKNMRNKSIGYRPLTQSYTRETCEQLMNFVADKQAAFTKRSIWYDKDKTHRYPMMKLLDMYLWEIGYELSLVEILEEYHNRNKGVNQEKVNRIKTYCQANNTNAQKLKDEIAGYNK